MEKTCVRVIVAVDVATDNTEVALNIVQHLLRKVEWPIEIESVEVGEADETETEEVNG